MERRHRVGFEVVGVLFCGFAVVGEYAALYPFAGLWLMTAGLLRTFPSDE